MNPTFNTMLARLTPQQKMIGIGVIAFLLGMMLKGPGPAPGRYVPCGNSPQYLVDTQKGVVWEVQGGSYRRFATIP